MKYNRWTLVLNKQCYCVSKCCIIKKNKYSSVVGLPGGIIKVILNEYLFTNEYQAVEAAMGLNGRIKKVGEPDGQETA